MAKKASSSSDKKYTKPELRQKLKEQIQQDDKGGKKGQWSARKSQLLAQKYKAEGGGYKGGKEAPQKSMDKWTDEKWTTADGKKAQKGSTTDRYLPEEAWDKLSPEEKKDTRKKKQAGSAKGKQFVANTPAAKKSRKKATTKKKAVSKKTAAKKKVGKKVAKKTSKKVAKKTTKKTAKKTGKKTARKTGASTAGRKKVGRPKKKTS